MIAVLHIQAMDGRSIQRLTSPRNRAEENYIQRENFKEVPSFVWPPRTAVNVNDLVHEAYMRADEANKQEEMPPVEADIDRGATTRK